METRGSRERELARRIAELLERGARPDAIEAELVRRRMDPALAARLVSRVAAARRRVTPAAGQPLHARRSYVVNITTARARPFTTLRAGGIALVTALRARASELAMLVSLWLTRRNPAVAVRGVAAVALLFAGSKGVLHAVQGLGGPRGEDAVARLASEVEAAQSQIAALEPELTERTRAAERIDALRARLARGPRAYAGPDAYRAAVARYRRSLDQWNASLPRYRRLADEYRLLVALRAAKVDSLQALGGASAQP